MEDVDTIQTNTSIMVREGSSVRITALLRGVITPGPLF